MRVPSRRRNRGLRFNITPLIDVIFLLVIFFLVVTHFVQHEPLEAVELPKADEAAEEAEIPRRLVITVREDGTLHVRGRQRPLSSVQALIKEDAASANEEYEVRIRADRSAQYEVIEPLLYTCAEAGVTRVGFAVVGN